MMAKLSDRGSWVDGMRRAYVYEADKLAKASCECGESRLPCATTSMSWRDAGFVDSVRHDVQP